MMQIIKKKRWLAVLAMLLCVWVCCPAAAADEAEPQTDAAASETGEETFFDGLEAGNGIGTVLFAAGLGCVAVGGIGIACLIIWQKASAGRDRAEEDREDIFDEIEQAEQRNRRQREAERQAREYEARIAAREADRVQPAAKKYDPYSVTDEIPLVPDRAEYTVERPIVPTTPVSMQPETVQRPQRPAPKPAVQPRPAAKPAVPARPAVQPEPAAKPAVQPAAPKPEQQTAARPASAQPAAPRKFDLDDILREVRENNARRDAEKP
ncbi:MAG: hypothetical protein ACI4GO_04080 [Hominenteromicrobium sp.]